MASFTHYRVQNDIQLPVLSDSVNSEVSSIPLTTRFEQQCRMEIKELTEEHIAFDLIGVDASIANALRRILLAEVPTVAIETVYMHTNTSIIQDEVLSHRVGLIPIKVDPQMLQDYNEADGPTDLNTIVFKLDVRCEQTPALGPDGLPFTKTVYSSDLQWQPQGNQLEMFPDGVTPVHPDIVIAKLRPGQSIEFEAHCRKGVGKDHAKFSPCATAYYRLLPDIRFHKPIENDLAVELKKICPMNVFDIEDVAGVPTSVVARPRDCTMCRECIRTNGWENGDRVQLLRKNNHYLFTVESTGCIPPEVLIKQAIAILKLKAEKFLQLAEQCEDDGSGSCGSNGASQHMET